MKCPDENQCPYWMDEENCRLTEDPPAVCEVVYTQYVLDEEVKDGVRYVNCTGQIIN